MTKLIIPALLSMVILIAGIFAFVPVEQAVTVHDTLSNEVQALGDAICSEAETGPNSSDANLDTGECIAVEA